MERKSRLSELKSAIQNLAKNQIVILTTISDCVQARRCAKECEKHIAIISLPDGTWAMKLKDKPKFEVIKPSETISYVGHGDPIEYIHKPKHWELKNIPVGKSGIPLVRLGFYPEGHGSIAEEWLVYDAELDMIFKPKYVHSPSMLTNKVTRKLGLPDTKIMLDQDYKPLDAGESEVRFMFLDKANIVCQ